MDVDGAHRAFETARRRGELTVQELWFRYLGLGGDADEFAVDGFLQGIVPLDGFQQRVLAQALNERLQEVYEAARITFPDAPGAGEARRAIDELLGGEAGDGVRRPEEPT
jgi:hypothetical protein